MNYVTIDFGMRNVEAVEKAMAKLNPDFIYSDEYVFAHDRKNLRVVFRCEDSWGNEGECWDLIDICADWFDNDFGDHAETCLKNMFDIIVEMNGGESCVYSDDVLINNIRLDETGRFPVKASYYVEGIVDVWVQHLMGVAFEDINRG